MRRAVNKHQSRSHFNRQARKTHVKNVRQPPRGGYRL